MDIMRDMLSDTVHNNMLHVEQHVVLAGKGVPYNVYCELSLIIMYY